jgi:hypothetical protein
MQQMFQRITANPKSSCIGLLLAVTTVTGALTAQGVTLGHAGTGTTVTLISGVATALMGLLARD